MGAKDMRTLAIAFLLLLCVSAQATTNTTPQAERIFAGRIWKPQYAGILRFRKGMTLREVLDQTPFKGKTVQVLILRPGTRISHDYITVGPSDKPKSEVRPLDWTPR